MDLLTQPVFLAPDASFAALDRCLRSHGWVRDRAGSDEDGGPEPLFASWSLPEEDGEIDYSCEPELELRRLEVRGRRAGETLARLSRSLPLLTVDDVRELLRAADPASLLLGLRIAPELRSGRLADAVIALTAHPHEVVRTTAQGVVRQAAAEISPAAPPSDPAALFRGIPDARYRRQTLRWLLHDRAEADPAIRQTVAAALGDSDWEVRATAVLAAARWRITEALPLVHACSLEPRNGLGPVRSDAVLLRQIGRLAEHVLLAGPPLETRLYRSVAGLPIERPDHGCLLVHALTTPVPNDVPGPPEPLPAGIVRQLGGYLLERAGLSCGWIPPVEHWLGDDLPGLLAPRQIERVRPEHGFFIADVLFRAPSGEPWSGSLEAARAVCGRLAAATGLDVRLPTADAWEMAARGPDGRIFPWGNGIDPDAGRALSPWGCREMVGVAGQWSDSRDSAGRPLVCGVSRHGCSPRAPRDPEESFALRPVIVLTLREPFRPVGAR